MLALGAQGLFAGTGGGIDDALRKGRESNGIPVVTGAEGVPPAVAANREGAGLALSNASPLMRK